LGQCPRRVEVRLRQSERRIEDEERPIEAAARVLQDALHGPVHAGHGSDHALVDARLPERPLARIDAPIGGEDQLDPSLGASGVMGPTARDVEGLDDDATEPRLFHGTAPPGDVTQPGVVGLTRVRVHTLATARDVAVPEPEWTPRGVLGERGASLAYVTRVTGNGSQGDPADRAGVTRFRALRSAHVCRL
jgi:hypothetical protein